MVTPLWAVFTTLALLSPHRLSPLGFVAATLLLFVSLVPMLLPILLFDARVSPRFVDATIEALEWEHVQGTHFARVTLLGETYQCTQQQAASLAPGQRVQLLCTGFMKKVLRVERL